MTNERFKDRNSEYPNRRKLTIINQTPYEIIADIERADKVINNQNGTPLNATVLNEWDEKVQNASNNANVALNIAEGLKESPDCSMANSIGVPHVELVPSSNGQVKFAFKNMKGNPGNDAGFGQITATATALPVGATPYANIASSGDNTAKNISFNFGLPAGIQGEKGDNIFVRYSFDKQSLTDVPTDNTMYIGFYSGRVASEDPNLYQWVRFWGAKSISETEYKNLLTSNQIDNEQIYFIEGSGGNELILIQKASDIKYDGTSSGLFSNNVQDAINELKSREFSKSYNDLLNKPNIPNVDNLTLAGLAEKSYNSLTDKPYIPDYRNLTLSGLAEKSYNSLTDKPIIPQITIASIAMALGLTELQLSQLVELAKITTITPDGISFDANSINIK